MSIVNSILYGRNCTSLKNINRLWRIQHSLFWLELLRSHALLSATALLRQLHWLPVEWRIRFKLATMTFKALHTGRQPYLTDLLQYYQPTRSLRSSGSYRLVKPQHNLSFGSRTFHISAPHIWNSLPANIHEVQSILTFRCHFKRTTFSQPFPPRSDPPANVPAFFLRYWHYINHLLIYLLKGNIYLQAVQGSMKMVMR